jgi:Pro-kumamolisin, activation domain/Subtilase family
MSEQRTTPATPAERDHQLPIADFVLYAEQRLTLGTANRVTGGGIGVRSIAREPAGVQLSAASDSVIEPDRAIISPSVALGHHVVRGEILTDALVDHAVPLRPERPFPASQMPPLPLAPAPAAGTEGVTVPAGQAASLSPGSYGAAQIDGSLVLNPGEYVFSSVTLGHRARMVSVGVVQVVVLDYLTAGWEAEIHPLFEQRADQLTISVAGTDQGPALPTASFGERSRLRALLNVPHGLITLADQAAVRGAAAGFAITTGEDVEAAFECGFPQSSAGQHGSQQLTGAYGVPPVPGTDPVAGPIPADTGISLSIGLPVRDGAGLQALIAGVSDPKSAQFRKYITPDQFNATYGATAEDYAALQSWADGAGFDTIATFPNNLLLRVTGTAAQVQEALFVNLFYRVRPDGSQYIATDRELSLNLSTPVLEINGLGDSVLPVSLGLNGTGGGGNYRAADLRNAYLGVDSAFQALDGSGQNVGIVGFVTFTGSDITGYFDSQASAQGEISPLPAPNATVVEVEAAPIFGAGPPPNSTFEADLDVEMVYAMAPEATILFFQGTTGITDRLDSILHGMATFTPALTVASCSLAFGKSDSSQQALDQMAAQGVSFFTASGDSGNVGGNVYDSTKMNHQTLVGGTVLSTNQLTGAGGYPVPYYAGESTWPSSGGGIISDVTIPGYQTGIMQISAAANGGSLTNRNYPDVAMLAINAEFFSGGNLIDGGSGTSFAAPLWAGFTALVNQLSLQNGAGLMGFLSPTLYDIGLTINDTDDLYDLCFNDIQDNVGNGGFKSVRGYDLVTGLGTPKTGLITQLTTASPVTPAPLSIIRFIVGTGGDDLRNDSTATADVFLKNGGQFTVTLKAKNAGDWGNGSTHGPIDFAIPDTVTPPTITEGLSGVQINLIQGGSFPETDDNWDISTLQVSLFNPGTPQVCQLNLVGDSELQDGSIGLVRLSGSAGSSGVGPSSPIYKTGPGSGC